jgi:hypothetical protein
MGEAEEGQEMRTALVRSVAALIDRICELSIENHVLKEMIRNADTVPVPPEQLDRVLQIVLHQPEADIKRKEFAARRDSVLHSLDRDEKIDQKIEELLKSPTKGLPN